MNMRRTVLVCLFAAIEPSAAWAVTAEPVGAPANASYITQTADGSLSAEQALGSLATGLLKNTTTTGVLSIATANTDYLPPSGAMVGGTINNTVIGSTTPAAGNFTLLTGAPPANIAAYSVSSYSLTGANQQPLLDLAGTWSTTGAPKAIKLNITNTGSDAAARLLELQVGGVSKFDVSAAGAVRLNGDVVLERDAANTLAQRNGNSAQTFRIYETESSSLANYERGALVMGSDTFEIKAEEAGTGTDNLTVKLTPAGTSSVVINGPANLVAASELTIALDTITVTRSFHKVDTEADAATDNLTLINGGVAGDILVLRAEHSGRTVVVVDGPTSDNIQLNGDFSLDNITDTITLIFDAASNNWLEVARSNNGG